MADHMCACSHTPHTQDISSCKPCSHSTWVTYTATLWAHTYYNKQQFEQLWHIIASSHARDKIPLRTHTHGTTHKRMCSHTRICTHRSALSAPSQVKVSTSEASMARTTMLMATTNRSIWFHPLQAKPRWRAGRHGMKRKVVLAGWSCLSLSLLLHTALPVLLRRAATKPAAPPSTKASVKGLHAKVKMYRVLHADCQSFFLQATAHQASTSAHLLRYEHGPLKKRPILMIRKRACRALPKHTVLAQ
eukprot:1158760-Pelagomonas_calceolata.AAC.9